MLDIFYGHGNKSDKDHNKVYYVGYFTWFPTFHSSVPALRLSSHIP